MSHAPPPPHRQSALLKLTSSSIYPQVLLKQEDAGTYHWARGEGLYQTGRSVVALVHKDPSHCCRFLKSNPCC